MEHPASCKLCVAIGAGVKVLTLMGMKRAERGWRRVGDWVGEIRSGAKSALCLVINMGLGCCSKSTEELQCVSGVGLDYGPKATQATGQTPPILNNSIYRLRHPFRLLL
jgi:hypothetical protein